MKYVNLSLFPWNFRKMQQTNNNIYSYLKKIKKETPKFPYTYKHTEKSIFSWKGGNKEKNKLVCTKMMIQTSRNDRESKLISVYLKLFLRSSMETLLEKAETPKPKATKGKSNKKAKSKLQLPFSSLSLESLPPFSSSNLNPLHFVRLPFTQLN